MQLFEINLPFGTIGLYCIRGVIHDRITVILRVRKLWKCVSKNKKSSSAAATMHNHIWNFTISNVSSVVHEYDVHLLHVLRRTTGSHTSVFVVSSVSSEYGLHLLRQNGMSGPSQWSHRWAPTGAIICVVPFRGYDPIPAETFKVYLKPGKLEIYCKVACRSCRGLYENLRPNWWGCLYMG